jgi:hypothetical protein
MSTISPKLLVWYCSVATDSAAAAGAGRGGWEDGVSCSG